MIRQIKQQLDETGGDSGSMAERGNIYSTLVGKPEREIPLEDLGVNIIVLLKWILKNKME
jgi:hypothetical protein